MEENKATAITENEKSFFSFGFLFKEISKTLFIRIPLITILYLCVKGYYATKEMLTDVLSYWWALILFYVVWGIVIIIVQYRKSGKSK